MQLEKIIYEVGEGDGSVDVCTTLEPENCTLSLPFNLLLNTISDSAGFQLKSLQKH